MKWYITLSCSKECKKGKTSSFLIVLIYGIQQVMLNEIVHSWIRLQDCRAGLNLYMSVSVATNCSIYKIQVITHSRMFTCLCFKSRKVFSGIARPLKMTKRLHCGGSCRIMNCYYYNMCLANYGASEAVNLCSRSVEKFTKFSVQKCASYFRE